MSFGKNPHVAKAQDAEAKARAEDDGHLRASAWRDAARQWERAADKERVEKRANEYRAHAERARAEADGEPARGEAAAEALPAAPAPPTDRRSMN